jgi:hypothetical protein
MRKRPFPGMDPYLEAHWQDLHARLILYACDQLEEQLPANLIARVEERGVLETEDIEQRSVYPDVKIVERPVRGSASAGRPGRSSIMEPVIVQFHSEPVTETFINILDASAEHRLVTVIEILSLANKLPGEGQRLYRQKQRELRAVGVSLVEIDLLRKGQRVLSLPVTEIPRRLRTTYQACVRRGWKPDTFEIYPLVLRQRLPAIRIPLRETDDDIHLDLQSILDQAYRKGRYHASLDYQRAPDPPLPPEDARWARAVVKKAGRGS